MAAWPVRSNSCARGVATERLGMMGGLLSHVISEERRWRALLVDGIGGAAHEHHRAAGRWSLVAGRGPRPATVSSPVAGGFLVPSSSLPTPPKVAPPAPPPASPSVSLGL